MSGEPPSRIFVFQSPTHLRYFGKLSERLPLFSGRPLRVDAARDLCDRHGPVHAGSFLRERRIALDCTRAEFPRIFVHEVFHFAWLRAGNPNRQAFERLLAAEIRAGIQGELGWSAEWRKAELTPADIRRQSRRWREYCCESFCDTAAWLYCGIQRHPEFTLVAKARRLRRAWFQGIESRGFSI